MKTSSQERIENLTSKGWWGSDTLHGLLAKAVDTSPNVIAVADQPNRQELMGVEPIRLDYVGLDKASDIVAQQLLNEGVKINDIVIVQLPNIAELVVTYYAASKIGAIISPVPIQFAHHELAAIGEILDSNLFITTSTFREYQLAAEALTLDVNVFSYGHNVPEGAKQLSISDNVDCSNLRKYQKLNDSQINDANNIITICWTSGTTGKPKGVPRSHNMWLATTHVEIEACDYQRGDNLLNPFPLVNMAAIGGFLFPSILTASSLFLHHPLDPKVYLQQLQEEKITFTIAPPPLLNQLAKSADMWNQFDFSALRRIGSGSAPLAPWMVDVFSKKYGVEIINFYGSNEGICLLATAETSPEADQRASMFPRLGCDKTPWSGGAFDSTKTKVIDLKTGKEVNNSGEHGELLIAGPTIFDHYFSGIGQPPVEPESFTEDGYFRTGDIVEICGEQAFFYKIIGRCKDVINRGGMKISPVEIDLLLESMNNIKEVAVCAYPDERLGEKICVCLVPNNDTPPPSLENVIEHLNKAEIAKFKLPEKLEIFDALPRNAMGKVLRYQLRDRVSS